MARRLQSAEHAAVLVGGGIRDVLLGLPADDWDLATSATPDEVTGLFRRTIPTGVQHGTVTVLVRRTGTDPVPVEVTTFRGEGAYVDGRRPQRVTFLRDLTEDLARRDFTVNALAWDPVDRRFSDPFDGLADLRSGLIRAVGDPARRFQEDGLRTMRAVRLCATREFTLEPATQGAIGGALTVLDKVSRERVHVELRKLLGARQPSRGLGPMRATNMWSHVLPQPEPAALTEAIAAVDAMRPDPEPRLARLLLPLTRAARHDELVAALDALRPSKRERARVLALAGPAVLDLEAASIAPATRRAVARLGREHLDDALAVLAADPSRTAEIRAACDGAPLTTRELAIAGGDLIGAGIVAAGPDVGDRLRMLLDRVLDDPGLNEPATLLELARGS